MSQLPKGWIECNISKIIDNLESGSRPKGGVKGIKEGIPSIGGEHLNYTGGFNFTKPRFIPIKYAASMKKGLIKNRDILIVKDGATTGKTSFVGDNYPYKHSFVNEHVFIVRIAKILEPKFVFRYLFSDEGQKRILENFKGSAQGGINLSFINNLQIPLAPLHEQKRIVEKLDKLLAKVDSGKERLDKIPLILKRFRQSVLSAAVSGELTREWRESNHYDNTNHIKLRDDFAIDGEAKELFELPNGWQWCALGNYAKLSRGRFSVRPRNDPRYYNGKIPFIQIGDLPKEGGLILSHKQTLNEAGLKVSKKFNKNTVAIAIVGATIGNTGILSYDMCFPDSLVGIESEDEFTSYYIDYYLRTEKNKIRNISYSSGGQPNIKIPTLTNYPFPLPPAKEQKEIVRQVEKLFQHADKIEERYNKAKEFTDKLTQSILAKAFRGELVPQDPNDTPASELLEKIKQEKGEAGKKKAIK